MITGYLFSNMEIRFRGDQVLDIEWIMTGKSGWDGRPLGAPWSGQ